jgi:hypothetical protein
MRSSSLLYTVLLASAVTIEDTECHPVVNTVSKAGPIAKQALKTATGSGKSFSSSAHKGLQTGKEAVAIVDANDGHHFVNKLRESGLYSSVHAVVPHTEAEAFYKKQLEMSTSKDPSKQAHFKVFGTGHGGSQKHPDAAGGVSVHPIWEFHDHMHAATKKVDVFKTVSQFLFI